MSYAPFCTSLLRLLLAVIVTATVRHYWFRSYMWFSSIGWRIHKRVR